MPKSSALDARGRLLQVARRRFATDGAIAATLEEIRRDAEVSVGALYHHFPDKPDASGTALICACDEDKWALFKDNEPTMLSAGLMQSLLRGDDAFGDRLTIGNLYDLTRRAIDA